MEIQFEKLKVRRKKLIPCLKQQHFTKQGMREKTVVITSRIDISSLKAITTLIQHLRCGLKHEITVTEKNRVPLFFFFIYLCATHAQSRKNKKK